MLTAAERAGLRIYLRGLPQNPAFRSPCLPATAVESLGDPPEVATMEQIAEAFDPGEPPAQAESAAALAEALTGLKVLLDLARSLPLSRAAAVLVDRVGKTSRRLETQLGKLRTA